MKQVRWAAAALITLYSLFSLMPLVMTLAHKLGRLGPLDAEMARYLPLMEATGWWQLGMWAAALGAYLWAVTRLVRGGRALAVYGAAVLVDVALLVSMRAGGAHSQVFTPQELALDYYILAALAAVGAGIWWTERDGHKPSAPAAA